MTTTTTKLTIIVAALLFSTTAFAAGTAINETGEMPDASAILDARSTTKGFLPPRMTAAQRGAIASPTAGLQVYQTDAPAGLYLYNGSSWSLVGSGAGTVTSVSASAPLSVTNGTTTPAISLSGAIPVANGGTGATTVAEAASAILPAQTGNSGKYLTTDGSSTSWGTVVASGGSSSSTITATASGALSAGQLVEFTSTGEVKSIVTTNSGTSDAISSFVASQAIPGAGTSPQPQHIVSTFVGTDKVVVAYSQSDGLYVAAGALTGNSVIWGQAVKVSGNFYPTGICMLEVDRFAITYSSQSAPSTATGLMVVGKLTGTAITMGASFASITNQGYNFQCVGLGNNYIAFSGSYGFPETWKYDSTTLTLTFKNSMGMIGTNTPFNITQYDTDKYLYATAYVSDLAYSWAMYRTGDTSAAYGSQIGNNNSAAMNVRVVKTSLTNNPSTMLYVYWNSAGTAQYARTATITTGNVITWQSAPVAIPSGFTFSADNMTLVNTADHMAVLIGSINGADIRAVSINTASGTPVIGSYTTLLASGNARNIINYGGNGGGSNGRFITAYCDTADSNKPKVIVGQMGNSNTVNRANATGIVTAGAANGGTATIALLGSTASVYSGLTPGAIYYIQTDGSIGTAVTPYPAGVAINSTTLQMYSTGAISNSSITVTQNGSNQIKSNTGKTAVYTEFSQGDESVRVYANGNSSFYADGHTDSSLNVDRGMIYTTVSIGNLASGGAIGTAAATVDMGTMFNVGQTTANQTIILPSPTNVKAGRIVYLCNNGSTAFTAYGAAVSGGTCQMAVWTGSVWAGLNAGGGGVPAGTVSQYAGSTAPGGYLLCDGTAVSRGTYATLFAAIGVAYGNGDGSTTFNLPNLKGKLPVGYDASQTEFNSLNKTGGEKSHTMTTGEMPNHSHTGVANAAANILPARYVAGSLNGGGSGWTMLTGDSAVGNAGNYHDHTITIDSTGSGTAFNVLPPYVTLNYIIKY